MSALTHKISQKNKKGLQVQWNCELKLSFIVEGATQNRHQGYKAERYPRGEIFKKSKNEERRFLIMNILGMMLLK